MLNNENNLKKVIDIIYSFRVNNKNNLSSYEDDKLRSAIKSINQVLIEREIKNKI